MGAERRKGNHKGCPYGGLSEPIFVGMTEMELCKGLSVRHVHLCEPYSRKDVL